VATQRLVVRLIARQFPRWAGLAVTRVRSAGTDNEVFRLGDELAVRLPRTAGTAAALARELRWLPRLAPALPIDVPVPVGRGAPDEGFPHPWSVYRWLPGRDAVAEPITDLAEAAERLGRFVAALRGCDATGGPPSFRGGPIRERDAEARATIAALAADLDARRASAVWDDACAAPPWDGPPVWLHADLHPANLVSRAGRLAGVLDFGGLGVGDPACDLLPAWALLTAGTRAPFREASGVDDATWARGRGWGLYLGLGALHVYRVTNPVLAAIGRHALTEVLNTPSA
jgi:aminoglycoside phosphotransferase (APT) family kinase protein